MIKETAYEIHLSVDPQGQPVLGYRNYKLEGDPAEKTIQHLTPAQLTLYATLLSGNEAYFDTRLNKFVRKN